MADDIRDAYASGGPSRGDSEVPRGDLIALDLWERFLAGQATDAECASVRAWAASVTGDADAAEHLRTVLLTHPHTEAPPSVDAGAFLVALRARLGLADPLAADVPHLRRDSSRIPPFRMPGTARPGVSPRLWSRGVGGDSTWRVAAIAASVVVALGVGLGLAVARHRAGLGTAAGREYTTAAGQRLSVTLVDGTWITMAPASRVRLAAGYGRGARRVELEGEAYFAVAHDPAHPFVVRAHGAAAQDVGTAFDVRAYPEDPRARIVVTEGAVAVSAATACRAAVGAPAVRPLCAAEARAGDVASVGTGGVVVEHGVDIASLTEWRAGALQFRDTPVSQVAAELRRWYDLDIAITDSSLGAYPITLSVRDNAVDESLDAVAVLAHARYERHGRRVTFFRHSEDR